MVPIHESNDSLNKEVSIIAGLSSSHLAEEIAKHLDTELVPAEIHIFPDGESKVKIKNPDKKKYCIVIQSIYPPIDRHLLQALMMINKCNDYHVANVYAVIPYLAYARQDRAFLEEEVITIALIAKLFEAVGTKRLITVDIHSSFALSHFTIDVQNISSIPILARYVSKKIKLNKPIVVSPDTGGIERAQEFAKILKMDMIVLKKSRDRKTGEVSIDEKLDSNIEGKDVLIVDDMISTGESIVKACLALKKNKSGKVYAICAHALLVGDAKQKLKAAGIQDIIATNSIPSEFAKADLSHIISENIINLIQTC